MKRRDKISINAEDAGNFLMLLFIFLQVIASWLIEKDFDIIDLNIYIIISEPAYDDFPELLPGSVFTHQLQNMFLIWKADMMEKGCHQHLTK
ncbi:MAG: hypothetical protein AB1632_13725 [Nitrospirota bacterium]